MSRLLQELVTAQADLRPEAAAVVWKNSLLSYRELEQQSNQFARALRAIGCRRGDRVCLLASKSLAAIVTILAIYKADCIYVPLDPFSPRARLAKILRACEPRGVIVAPPAAPTLAGLLRDGVTGARPAVVALDEAPLVTDAFRSSWCLADLPSLPDQSLAYRNRSSEPAHMFFASGSSSTPTGIVITHDNVSHFVAWANQYFGVTPADRLPGHSSLAFDLSIYDIFGALAAGACLFPVPLEANLLPATLGAFIRRNSLTHWLSTPSTLSFIAGSDTHAPLDFPELRRVIWCGDSLPMQTLRRWMTDLPQARFTNLYGPTETTIASSYYTVPACPLDDRAPLPIGKACRGEELLVLNDDLTPVPRGQIGEICIRGVGLSPGYWREPETTRHAFVLNPRGEDFSDRLYRTGDLGRVGPDDLLYLVGRRDLEIMSRGHRFDLGEIEASLAMLPSIRDAVVVAMPTEGFEGVRVCCAFVPTSGWNVTVAGVRRQLARLLPAYMLPSRWKAVDRLPLNTHGKPDRTRVLRLFEASESVPS